MSEELTPISYDEFQKVMQSGFLRYTEREILKLRYGNPLEPKTKTPTFKEIGAIWEKTDSWARQIHNKAVQKLNNAHPHFLARWKEKGVIAMTPEPYE